MNFKYFLFQFKQQEQNPDRAPNHSRIGRHPEVVELELETISPTPRTAPPPAAPAAAASAASATAAASAAAVTGYAVRGNFWKELTTVDDNDSDPDDVSRPYIIPDPGNVSPPYGEEVLVPLRETGSLTSLAAVSASVLDIDEGRGDNKVNFFRIKAFANFLNLSFADIFVVL
jgi:hypothetical protein